MSCSNSTFDGRPVSGAWAKVDIDKTGKVFNVVNDLLPRNLMKQKTAAAKKEQKLTRDEAIQAALAATKIQKTKVQKIEDPEIVAFPYQGEPVMAWKVMLKAGQPAREWKVYVRASDGKILEKISLIKYVGGQGRVFNPNPVVVLDDPSLKDSSVIPAQAYEEVTLENLDSSGFLDGSFVSTKRTANRVQSNNHSFKFKRPDRAFKEVMVYYHIDQVQQYIQSLGFDNVNNRAIEVNIDGTTQDNSFYSPMTKSLTFGTGGVDDAEDADIILHEYGHSIQDNQVPGFGPSGEARAMGEGFGDYLAGSFFESLKSNKLKPCVGTWDAVAYSNDDPPNLRRLDSAKKYPQDMEGEEHADGEIWSACLWQLRGKLGQKKTDKLVFAHHFLIPSTASFKDASQALITADQNLNGGANEAKIRDICVRRGIFAGSNAKEKAKKPSKKKGAGK